MDGDAICISLARSRHSPCVATQAPPAPSPFTCILPFLLLPHAPPSCRFAVVIPPVSLLHSSPVISEPALPALVFGPVSPFHWTHDRSRHRSPPRLISFATLGKRNGSEPYAVLSSQLSSPPLIALDTRLHIYAHPPKKTGLPLKTPSSPRLFLAPHCGAPPS